VHVDMMVLVFILDGIIQVMGGYTTKFASHVVMLLETRKARQESQTVRMITCFRQPQPSGVCPRTLIIFSSVCVEILVIS
jgi:hypothetical protein